LHGQSRPGENWENSTEEDRARRSVYIHVKRSLPVPLLANFDAADCDSSCAVRFNTVQPTQALGLLNSEFVNEQAATFAQYVVRQEPMELPKQIEIVLQQVFQRPALAEEIERGLEFINQLREEGTSDEKSLQLFCVVALNLNEFLFVD
jgi:hypothetical protein